MKGRFKNINNLAGACHPECRFCAIGFFRWLKGREKQMSQPRKGETVSFSEAAATSNIPD